MHPRLDATRFHPYLNETFELIDVSALQTQSHSFILIDVTEFGDAEEYSSADKRPFSLLFLDPAGGYLARRIYTLVHPTLGELAIFIIPISSDSTGTRYQAIFS